MNKHLFKALTLSLLFGVVGCQSTSSGFFNPFPQRSTPTQAVQDALASTGDPDIMQVRVTPGRDGVILSGYVKKIRQSDMAEQLARQTGVRSVENNIIVKP